MKLAHLIMAHNAPGQLLRLVERLKHPDADIYLYIDAKSTLADFEDLRGIKNVTFISRRIPVSWCGYSTVNATLIALKEILETRIAYSHINFLSGLDYPLKYAEEVHQFFLANTDKSYLATRSVITDWEDGLARTKKFYLGDYNLPGKHRFQNAINSLNLKRRVPGSLDIYGGSQWFTITPQAALYVVNYLKIHKKLARYFKLTFAPDEIVFQTILMASPFKNSLVNDNLRYIRMSPITHRPEILIDKDEHDLLNSNKFYARKFDPEESVSLLNKLDASVLSHY